MGFLSSLFSRSTATPTAKANDTGASSLGFAIPAILPKLPHSTDAATDPASQLRTLLAEKKASEAVDLLATHLPERDAIQWAAECCADVAPRLTPDDIAALESCQAWLSEPSADHKEFAAAAVRKAGHRGPGAWAAQAVEWTQPTEPTANAATAFAPLLAKAVAGSVRLAAALSQPEISLPTADAGEGLPTIDSTGGPLLNSTVAELAPAPPADELCRMYKPFLDRGIAIAAS